MYGSHRLAARHRGGRLRTLVPPEPLEPVRRKLRVPHRVVDVLVSKVMLQRPGVVAIVGQLEPAGVPEHVRVGVAGNETFAWMP
mgnify:CR=1 FL=1